MFPSAAGAVPVQPGQAAPVFPFQNPYVGLPPSAPAKVNRTRFLPSFLGFCDDSRVPFDLISFRNLCWRVREHYSRCQHEALANFSVGYSMCNVNWLAIIFYPKCCRIL